MISILHISSAVTWRGGEQQIAYLLQNKNIENILLCVENSALHQYAIANKITHRTYKKIVLLLSTFMQLQKNKSKYYSFT